MNVLAFDTSTETLDILLQTAVSGFRITRKAGLRHSELLLPAIDYILKDQNIGYKDLDLLVAAKGPGSFTGLRIGISTAKGLSLGANCPLVSIPTLTAMAYPFREIDLPVLAIIDARKKRFYAQLFHKGLPESELLDASAIELQQTFSGCPQLLLSGQHSRLFLESLSAPDSRFKICNNQEGCAPALIQLGIRAFKEKGADIDGDGPMYVRKSDAEIENEAREKAL